MKALVGSGGKLSISAAMVKGGYSKNTINTPQKLTESVGWHELVTQYIPDTKVLKRLSRNLDSKSDSTANEAIRIAIDIKGRSGTQKVQIDTGMESLTDNEIDEKLSSLEAIKKFRDS